MRTVYNKYRQEVRMACFSCKYCDCTGSAYRCECVGGHFDGEKVERKHCCELWEMKDGLQNAGKGDGQVKKVKYLNELADGKLMGSITASREMFAKKHGSIYEVL